MSPAAAPQVPSGRIGGGDGALLDAATAQLGLQLLDSGFRPQWGCIQSAANIAYFLAPTLCFESFIETSTHFGGSEMNW